ncbi:MAG TPA: response regulator FixJ [Alphaproteobacteria bacterium]|nr:response regulator FixJ [Alphaproteobacteria bacterium]
MAAAPTVHIVDDDLAMRDSLAFLLGAEGLVTTVYESAAALLANVQTLGSGCIVTDVRMPGMTGIELMRRLKEMGIAIPVIVITGHGDVPLAVEAMRGGALDFIEKPFDDALILRAVRNALVSGAAQQEREEERAAIATRLATLSNRELQVLEGLVAGHANKVIAYDLGISPRTVEVYRANLMTKMQADSLSDLVRMKLLME